MQNKFRWSVLRDKIRKFLRTRISGHMIKREKREKLFEGGNKRERKKTRRNTYLVIWYKPLLVTNIAP